MRRASGFTLLEVLAALCLTGFVLLLITQGLRFGDMTRERLAASAAETDALSTADRIIRNLIEASDPGNEQNPAGFTGRPMQMTWRTTLPRAAGT